MTPAMMTEAPTATIVTTRAMIAATAIPATMTEVPTLIAAMTRAMTTELYTDSSYDDGSSYTDSSSDTSYDDSSSSDTTDTSTSASSSDRELLAGLIYCEAGNQSWDGKVAVGAVVLNRVASSSFASTIKGVIYESGQFSPAGSGWLDSVIANGSIPSSCYDAADAALAGENPIGSAMYFNTGSGKGIKIGAHQFY